MLKTLIQTLMDQTPPPRLHNNTAVVSVQEYLTPMEPEVVNATEYQAEDNITRESSDFIYNNSEESNGYDDFPQDIQNDPRIQH